MVERANINVNEIKSHFSCKRDIWLHLSMNDVDLDDEKVTSRERLENGR